MGKIMYKGESYSNNFDKKDAIDIAYDNSTSGLAAPNVQAAIDEVSMDSTGVREIYGSNTAINNCNNAELGVTYFVYPSATNAPFPGANSTMITTGNAAYKVQMAYCGDAIRSRYFKDGSWSSWYGYRRIETLNVTMTTNSTGDVKPAIPSGADILSVRADGMICLPLHSSGSWYVRCFDGAVKAAPNQTRSFFFIYAV